jgi:hypothetical protein
MSRGLPGGIDPGDWFEYWQGMHHSDTFPGILARFALELIESEEDGLGARTFRFVEPKGEFEVRVEYVLETFVGRGRVVHVLSILSPGDPRPTWER